MFAKVRPYPKHGMVVAGSTNLTSGGLWETWEASLAREFGAYFDRLGEGKEIVEAAQKAAANLIARVVERKGDVYLLADVPEMMRGDRSKWGVETQAHERRENTAKAVAAMRSLAATIDARTEPALQDHARHIGFDFGDFDPVVGLARTLHDVRVARRRTHGLVASGLSGERVAERSQDLHARH